MHKHRLGASFYPFFSLLNQLRAKEWVWMEEWSLCWWAPLDHAWASIFRTFCRFSSAFLHFLCEKRYISIFHNGVSPAHYQRSSPGRWSLLSLFLLHFSLIDFCIKDNFEKLTRPLICEKAKLILSECFSVDSTYFWWSSFLRSNRLGWLSASSVSWIYF